MRVFLAGATSVVGSPLVPQLVRAGHRVTAMTRSVLRGAQLEAAGADPVVCDVFDADRVREAMAAASPDAVIHQLTAMPTRLDWGNPDLFKAHNRVRAEGARILLDAALTTGAHRIVAQSIAFAYAPTGDLVKDEDAALFTDAPPPLGGAIAAVAEVEQLITGTGGIEGLVLRYGMLYGPGTYHDRLGSTAADIIAARMALYEGATGLYSWLHVDDAASAAVAALEQGAPGIYNVVDDEPAAQPEWLPVLARALRADPPPAAETPPPAYTPEMSLRGASNAKAKRELGWRPRYPSWRDGFAASLA
jgi:nucleoside-diphosphate-sugar epimerase